MQLMPPLPEELLDEFVELSRISFVFTFDKSDLSMKKWNYLYACLCLFLIFLGHERILKNQVNSNQVDHHCPVGGLLRNSVTVKIHLITGRYIMRVISVQSLAEYKFDQTHRSRLFDIFVSLFGAIIVPLRSVTLLYHEIFFKDFDIFLKIEPSSSGLIF